VDDPYKAFRILIKFMDESRVDSFVNEGLLYMNNIGYFREYEDSDIALRADVDEGLLASYQSDAVSIHIDGHELEETIGNIRLRYNHEDETNIYSMTKISDGHILEAGDDGLFLSKKFEGFGSHAVVVGGNNITEFEARLSSALSSSGNIYTPRKDQIMAMRLNYLNRDDHNGRMDVFQKFNEYEWQHEWRIAFKQKDNIGAYPLKIGDLSDITQVRKTKDLISQPIKLVPSKL